MYKKCQSLLLQRRLHNFDLQMSQVLGFSESLDHHMASLILVLFLLVLLLLICQFLRPLQRE